MTALEPGKVLDRRYRIIQTLAKGGFGRTYIAEDTRRPGNPQCVVKHLKPASHDSTFLDHARRLFAVEAETLEQLGNHDQIPRLLAYFEEEQEFYLVQDLIEGHPLSYELQINQTWPDRQIWQMLQDILRILVFVHGRGVIHRDIKPDNIIRRRHDGKLVLVDFGAVKQIQTHPFKGNVTSTIAVGTPGYMPTEQSNGKPRPNSDIYALGIIGIQAATGLPPAKLPDDVDTGELIWSSQLPDELTAILARMVRYHFKDRYQSASDALYAIEQLLGQYPALGSEIRYSSIALKSTTSNKQAQQKLPAAFPPVLSLPKLTEPKLTEALSSLEDTLAAPSAAPPQPTATKEDVLVAVGEALQPSPHSPPVTELSSLVAVDPLSAASEPSSQVDFSIDHLVDSPSDHADVLLESNASDGEPGDERSPQGHMVNSIGVPPDHPLTHSLTHPPDHDAVSALELVSLPSTLIDLRDAAPQSVRSTGDRPLRDSQPSPSHSSPRRWLDGLWIRVPRLWRRGIQKALPGRFEPVRLGTGGSSVTIPANFPVWKVVMGAGLAASMVVVGIPAVVRALFFVEQTERPSPPLASLPVSQILVVGLPCQVVAPSPLADQQPLWIENGATSFKYYGSTQKGKPADGQGTSVFSNGDRFDGEFRNGAFNGCGTVTFTNRYVKTYVGQFQAGLYQGIGLLSWKNGDRYIGQFKDGKCQGEGTFISAKYRQSINGVWRNGDLVGSDLSCNKVNR